MSAATPPRKLPGSLDTNRRLDRWLRINRNETVTVYPGKVEYGQGILTALSQIVAEELDVKLARIVLERTNTSYSPDEGVTSGSRSLQEGGEALRQASAEARQLLLERAAVQLGVSLEQLSVTDGIITARNSNNNSSVSYCSSPVTICSHAKPAATLHPNPPSFIPSSAPTRRAAIFTAR